MVLVQGDKYRVCALYYILLRFSDHAVAIEAVHRERRTPGRRRGTVEGEGVARLISEWFDGIADLDVAASFPLATRAARSTNSATIKRKRRSQDAPLEEKEHPVEPIDVGARVEQPLVVLRAVLVEQHRGLPAPPAPGDSVRRGTDDHL